MNPCSRDDIYTLSFIFFSLVTCSAPFIVLHLPFLTGADSVD